MKPRALIGRNRVLPRLLFTAAHSVHAIVPSSSQHGYIESTLCPRSDSYSSL